MSSYQRLESRITKLTTKIDHYYARRGIQLVPDAHYYVYVLLDPRKPGAWRYQISDRTIEFDYKPFYVGKGKGQRAKTHSATAYDRNNDSPKKKTIRAIHRSGKEVLIRKTKLYSEADAFAREYLLIKHIGRLRDGGLLTNKAIGGRGGHGAIKGIPLSPEHRAALSEAKLGTRLSQAAIKKRKEYLRNRTKEAIAASAAKARCTMSKWTDKDRTAEWNRKSSKSKAVWEGRSEEQRQKVFAGWREVAKRPEVIAQRRKVAIERNSRIVECPHCTATGGYMAMKRWHFDKCKMVR